MGPTVFLPGTNTAEAHAAYEADVPPLVESGLSSGAAARQPGLLGRTRRVLGR